MCDRCPERGGQSWRGWIELPPSPICQGTGPRLDLPFNRRGADFAWPVHHALLGNGVLICEHLTGHPPLAGRRAEFLFGALNIVGGDGAPRAGDGTADMNHLD